MADVVTRTTTLKATINFQDGDYRMINIPNPRNNVTRQEVEAIDWTVLESDKSGAAFSSVGKTIFQNRTDVDYDIS